MYSVVNQKAALKYGTVFTIERGAFHSLAFGPISISKE